MELRPRKGRSAPSTPVVAKPSPSPTQRKKKPSRTPTPIFIPSDDEELKEDVALKEMHEDTKGAVPTEDSHDQFQRVDSALKEFVAAAFLENSNDETARVVSAPKDLAAAAPMGNGDEECPKEVPDPRDSVAAASTYYDKDQSEASASPKVFHIDLVGAALVEDADNESVNVDAASKEINIASIDAASRETDDDDGEDEDEDEDDDEDGGEGEGKMASIFFNSMKAHLQNLLEPRFKGLSVQESKEANQEIIEKNFTKSVVKEPLADVRLTGNGLSWSPEAGLSTSKASTTKAGKPRSVNDTIWGRDQFLQDGVCVPPLDPTKLNKLARKQKADTAGAKWFDLGAPTITPELKKELQLLKLRGALDPKRHYKAEDSKGLPKFFQVGTVIGGPADFYSGRLTKKEQKNSLADELLSDSSLTTYRKRKYLAIQDQKQAGGKGFWKKKKSKRTPSWAKI